MIAVRFLCAVRTQPSAYLPTAGRTAGLLLLTLWLPTGCVGREAYDRGCEFAENGEFDAAVSAFRDAHDAAPKNDEYYDAWIGATEQAIAWHRDEATNRFNERMLGPARAHIDKAISYGDADGRPVPGEPIAGCRTVCGLPEGLPAHPHSLCGVIEVNQKELTDLRRLILRALAAAEARADAGESHIRNGAWDEAVVALQEATELDRSSARAPMLLREAIAGAVPYHLSLADHHLATQAWDDCRSECSIVLSYRPEDPEAQLRLDAADDRQRARTLQQQAARLAADEEYLSAVDTLERARKLWPEDRAIAVSLRSTKDLTADALLTEARGCVDGGEYQAALELVDRAEALVPDKPGLAAARDDAESRWADALLRQADGYLARGQNELAWTFALHAAGISDAHVETRRTIDRCADSVRAELDCAIAILPDSKGGAHSQETVRACAMMTNALSEIAPPHLRIVERSNLSDILAEQDLAAAGVLDPGALERLAARLRNADLLLLVSTASRNSDTKESERWASVTQVTGTKLVRNPDYAAAQAALDRAIVELDEAHAAGGDLKVLRGVLGAFPNKGNRYVDATVRGMQDAAIQQAEQRYNTALVRLRHTPELKEVPNKQEYRYPVCQITRRATVTAAVRLVDVATGQVLWVEDRLTNTVERSDTYVKPDPQRGITGKRAFLPGAEQLYAEAVEGLEAQIAEAARALLNRRGEAYLARARRAASRDAATELFVQYLFDPGPEPAAESVNEALAAIVDGDLDAARRERCKQYALARLELTPRAAKLTKQETRDLPLPPMTQGTVAPTPAEEIVARAEPAPAPVAPPRCVQLVLFDKRNRDKANAFGLVFDVDDVTNDGVDLRVSRPGTKGPKFVDLLAGGVFDAHHVRGRVVEIDPDDERAVIEVRPAPAAPGR